MHRKDFEFSLTIGVAGPDNSVMDILAVLPLRQHLHHHLLAVLSQTCDSAIQPQQTERKGQWSRSTQAITLSAKLGQRNRIGQGTSGPIMTPDTTKACYVRMAKQVRLAVDAQIKTRNSAWKGTMNLNLRDTPNQRNEQTFRTVMTINI